MTINVTELQSIYASKRSPEDLKSLIIRLYSAGTPPPEITTRTVSKIFGYKAQGSYFTLAEPYGGLTTLSEQLLPHYEPKVQFDLDNLLIGQSNSLIDRAYEKVIAKPGIIERELEESLNSNQRTILANTKRLTEFGWIVPVRTWEKRKRLGFKYFPTKHADQILPSDLKLLKSVRKKSTFEYIIAIHLFDELTGVELSKSFKKFIDRSHLHYLTKKDILESFQGKKYKKYRLTKNAENAVTHILSYFLSVDKEATEDFMNSIRSRILRHRRTRVDKDKIIAERIERLLSVETLSAREVSRKLNLSYKTTVRIIRKLKDEGRSDGERISSRSSSTPEVLYSLTDDREVNEINKIKTSLRSASPTYGEKFFYYLRRFPVFTINDIKNHLNVSRRTVESLLKRLKKYGLVKNQPSIGWYSPMMVEHKGLNIWDTLRIKKTVENGIKGFKINFENGQYVATPEKSEKPIDRKYLIKIANSNNILIKDGMRPYFPGKFSWSLYGLHSVIIYNLRRPAR